MAGGPLAEQVVCVPCLFDDAVLTRAIRVAEGHESDQYRCERGHTFGVHYPDGPEREAQWPPPPEIAALARSDGG